MKYWTEYYSHDPEILGKKKKFDNTIYTFDIETTNCLILDNKIIEGSHYLELTEKQQKDCICVANMYIWMFGINENVYYGRTWNELYNFLSYIDTIVPEQKICYVHNLPFEFQFMQNIFDFEYVFARKKRKPIKLQLADFNFEFRCSLILTNSKLDKLPDTYGLKVRKLTGNLDYNILRNSKTNLSAKELAYCENDCLVVYEYIKKELETYKTLKKIPLTNTGHVRQELKEKVMKNYNYRHKVSKSVNTDPHVYNLLTQAFMRTVTHIGNWIYAGVIVDDVKSFDFASSYPYVITTMKFPSTKFKLLKIKRKEQMIDKFAYIIKVKFKNISSKFYNNFISLSRCLDIENGRYDNGRVISADSLEIVLTDIDFNIICDSYDFDSYEFIEVYYSVYDYLPIELVQFTLDKYKIKTEYKNVEGKEVIYAIEKGKFNSIYRYERN